MGRAGNQSPPEKIGAAECAAQRGCRAQPCNQNALPPDPIEPLAGRRLLRLADVKKLVGFSRSTIYRLISEGQFPDRIHYGRTAVRWRAADVVAWLNPTGNLDEE